MKSQITRGIKFIALILALLVTVVFADRLLCFKTIHGIRQARDMYVQPKDTIDVVFLGSSHVHYDINTALLWENYGIAAYDYSAAEQPLWITYYYLKELCKYQSPKLAVLDLYAPASFHDEYQYYYLSDNLSGIRFSRNKIDMIKASCEPDKLWDYFPSFVTYHLRYKELNKYDFEYLFMSEEKRQEFKGFTPHFKTGEFEEPYHEYEHVTDIPDKTREYLIKIIDFCKENGIELYLVVNPYFLGYEEAGCYNKIKEIADEQGVRFEDFNDWYDSMGLDFSTCLNDGSHLNYQGSCVYSDFLGAVLKALYEIPDRRGDQRWESWDRHVEYIRGQVERQDSEDVNEN